MPPEAVLKPVVWVGSSRDDLHDFPALVQSHVGYALYVAQRGGRHRDAKPLSGFGVEVVTDYSGDTFRAVYTVRLAGAVYVPHVFQKKSKSGRKTPHREIELIRRRLREAEDIAKGRAL
jgi:phage-related protein